MNNIIILFVTFLALSSSSRAADETETAFHYKKGALADPSKWSMTKKEWKICGTGKRQSPIDLSPGIARLVHNSTKLIQTYYKPVEATLKNRGYDIMVYNYSTFKKSSIFIFLLPISLHDRYVVWIRFHGMTTQGRL